MITHKHHIITRHQGGTDDPSNLVSLSIKDHAEAHRVLYEKYDRWQDRVAWQGLAKMIGHDEAIFEANSRAHKGVKHTLETKAKISRSLAKNWVQGKRGMIGKRHSEATRAKMRASQQQNSTILSEKAKAQWAAGRGWKCAKA